MFRTQNEVRLISFGCFCSSLLILTQVKVVGVEQELGQVEELGYELFDIGHVVLGSRKPSFTHTVKHPVCQVKMASLLFKHTERWFDTGVKDIYTLLSGILKFL